MAGKGFTLGIAGNENTFPNRAAALRHIAATVDLHGRKMPLHQHHMPTPDHNGGWSSWNHDYRWRMTFEQYQQLAPLQQRYARLRHFLTEVDAQWKDVPGSRIDWMDNSVTVDQVDRHGNKRTVQLVEPHGDAC